MNDKILKRILTGAVIFFAAAVIFCIAAIVITSKQNSDMEQKRLENETKLAQLQLPTFAPETETPVITEIPAPDADAVPAVAPVKSGKIVVLDAGHGKSSSEMSSDEKTAEGYEYNESRGGWGEWRHYKNGTFGADCYGSGCTELCPANASCWYAMGNGDRDTEPSINLANANAAKMYLEQMGYEVRMTRTSNEQNPSMNKRVSYCFPNGDTSQQPDASVYVCIHSNAGGGRGTSYISLEGPYRQSYIPASYTEDSNRLGQIINTKVAAASGLRENSPISTPYLILFNKCPVPIAYMEIGFFDSSSDLDILQSSSDAIGRAIAEGIDEYLGCW